jgi:hypothetical protein
MQRWVTTTCYYDSPSSVSVRERSPCYARWKLSMVVVRGVDVMMQSCRRTLFRGNWRGLVRDSPCGGLVHLAARNVEGAWGLVRVRHRKEREKVQRAKESEGKRRGAEKKEGEKRGRQGQSRVRDAPVTKDRTHDTPVSALEDPRSRCSDGSEARLNLRGVVGCRDDDRQRARSRADGLN